MFVSAELGTNTIYVLAGYAAGNINTSDDRILIYVIIFCSPSLLAYVVAIRQYRDTAYLLRVRWKTSFMRVKPTC